MAVIDPPRTHRRFSAEEVLRMVETGILAEDEPVELLEGELVVVSPQDPRHAATTSQIEHLLEVHGPPVTFARTHSPITAAADSLPEPDVALVRGGRFDFATRHPTAADLVLVVEISRSSLGIDRQKARVYARAGVPVYWLVDLASRRVEVCSHPLRTEGEYAERHTYGEDDELPVPETDASLPVRDLLP
jgi:Uma2 family endonuclease